MSFGGHVLEMIKRTNANNALRKKHRSRKDKMTDNLRKSKVNYNTLKEEKICEEELERIKLSIRYKLKQEQLRQNILVCCICTILLLSLFCLVYFS